MAKTIITARKSIEREYDEPLRDVVQGFAQMGTPRALVADTLGVTPDSLRSYCRVRKIRFRRHPENERPRPGRPAKTIRYQNRAQTMSDWAAEFGLSIEGARKRIARRRPL